MDKLKQIIAYVVKKRGREIREEDFVNILSYDRKWIPPASARSLFKISVDTNLLEKKGEYYIPSFELKELILPLDFKVTEDDVKKYVVEEDLFTQILNILTSQLHKDRRDILMEINNIKNNMKHITIEVAALISCKENNVDCSKFYEKVEEKIKSL